MASSKTFEDLDLSHEEIKRIETALKDEKFRKMFVEYAEEISDPENRKLREQEIEMMENERGMDIKFVNPDPGHVLKTTIDGKKAFINICTNDNIAKPTSVQTVQNGAKGLHWQIPHSFTPPREDYDKKTSKCMVYDVVFHPDTYRMANNPRFRKMVEDTAIDGIEAQFACKVDRNNLRHPKLKYKGTPVGTVIRKRQEESNGTASAQDDSNLMGMSYPYSNKTSEELAQENMEKAAKKAKEKANQEKKTKTKNEKKLDDGYTTPKYSIIHRTDMDLQNFTNAPDSRPTTAPRELEIMIELPLCKSAAGVDLDIFEDRLTLKSEKPAYNLEFKLPYPVDDENGSAKFDKSKKCLIVKLPVIPGETPKMPTFIDSDVTKEGENAIPLIEELPPLESVNEAENTAEDDLPPLKEIDNEVQTETVESAETLIAPAQKISYSLPQYEFSQDSETVTFIFHVRNITDESLKKSFPKPGSCQIKFVSKGSGGFPMHYSLLMVFGVEKKLVAEHCNVDISEKNMTLTLLKEKGCRVDWDTFSAGVDQDSLQEKVFVTPSTLCSQLAALQEQGETMVRQGEHSPEHHPKDIVQVTDLSPKKLTIKLKDPKSKISEEDEPEISEDECPSSAEIQVVHEKQVPQLHGILKQRSMSESSETSNSGDSPPVISPRDEKRCVHFNSHIDKATFKSNASVTSMKTVLKSKRRRNKKREEKIERIHRKRHHSGSSECSSCDEHDQQKLSGEEDQGDAAVLADKMDKTGKEVEDRGVLDEKDELKLETKVKEVTPATPTEVETEDKSSENEEQGEDSQKPGYQIQSKNGEKKVKMTSRVTQEVKSKLAQRKSSKQDEVEKDSDDDEEEEVVKKSDGAGSEVVQKNGDKLKQNGHVVDNTVVKKNVFRTSGGAEIEGECKEKSDLNDDDKSEPPGADANNQDAATTKSKAARGKGAEKSSGEATSGTNGAMKGQKGTKRGKGVKFEGQRESGSESGGESVKNGGKGDNQESVGKGDLKGEGNEGSVGNSEVETELSWKDDGRAAVNNEHRTACAFKFSNEVMYDLDVD